MGLGAMVRDNLCRLSEDAGVLISKHESGLVDGGTQQAQIGIDGRTGGTESVLQAW